MKNNSSMLRVSAASTLEHVVRFVLVNVEGGSADASVLQGLRQSRFIHQPSARRVHEESARPHLLDRVLVDQVMVVLVQRAVQRYTVRLEQQILQQKCQKCQFNSSSWINDDGTHLQSVDAGETQRALDTIRQIRIVEDDVESKGFSAQSYRRADATYNTNHFIQLQQTLLTSHVCLSVCPL